MVCRQQIILFGRQLSNCIMDGAELKKNVFSLKKYLKILNTSRTKFGVYIIILCGILPHDQTVSTYFQYFHVRLKTIEAILSLFFNRELSKKRLKKKVGDGIKTRN